MKHKIGLSEKEAQKLLEKYGHNKNIFDRLDIVWFWEVSALTTITTLIAFWVGQKISNTESFIKIALA